VVDGLRDLKEEITSLRREMNTQMSLLVSQREFDHTRDELNVEINGLRGRVEKGLAQHAIDIQRVERAAADHVQALKTALEASEQQRDTDRRAAESQRKADRWRAFGGLVAAAGLVIAVVSLRPSHRKAPPCRSPSLTPSPVSRGSSRSARRWC
jgi:chromosome segregation ATPase